MKDMDRQKENQARWYRENKQRVVDRHNAKRNENRRTVLERMKSGCVECGITDIRVLEFDHLPEYEKSFNISTALRGVYSTTKVIEEMNKCEVVCANCHAIRTRTRLGDWRAMHVEQDGTALP